MKKNTWLLIALIAIVFVSGASVGFFAGRLTAPKRSRRQHNFRSRERMKLVFKQHIYKKLKLTDEQKKSAQVIIERWLDNMSKLRQLHTPQYVAVFDEFYNQMLPILSTEQELELNKWRSKFNKRKYCKRSKSSKDGADDAAGKL